MFNNINASASPFIQGLQQGEINYLRGVDQKNKGLERENQQLRQQLQAMNNQMRQMRNTLEQVKKQRDDTLASRNDIDRACEAWRETCCKYTQQLGLDFEKVKTEGRALYKQKRVADGLTP